MATKNTALKRIYHRAVSVLAARIPALADRLVKSFEPLALSETPWTEMKKPLEESRIAIVTTAGVHHRKQPPYDMADGDGDPSFRQLDGDTIEDDYAITHDYYDHTDARRDLNVVFPLGRLREMESAGCIGQTAPRHISFMGHIDGPHIRTLVDDTAPVAAELLKQDGVDAALLSPA